MELDGRPVVYHLGLIKNGTYHLLKTSYAAAVKASGAATIAKARLVEDLIDSRMTRLDFGPELFEWKRVWADDIKWHTRLRAFNRTPAGYAAFAAEWLRSRVLRRGEVDDVQYRNRRDLRGPEASTRASTPSMASR
jgi:CelD/BcsL family acetyltransferase involved in cellulose biosynthesis